MRLRVRSAMLTILSMLALLISVIPRGAEAQQAGRYASVNGIRMYREIHGTGRPLVLIHGGGSTITTTFGTTLRASLMSSRKGRAA